MTTTATLDQRMLLALCGIKGLNWNLIAREAQRPDGLKRLLAGELTETTPEALQQVALLTEGLDRELAASLDRVEAELERAGTVGARLTTVLDDDYPTNLRLIFNLPPFLFYRGALLAADARSVAVVGTRDATAEGVSKAGAMASQLVAEGVTVVSGLARGIDTAAHTATLDAGGRTIAVVGTGITRCYPAENADLADAIAENGAVVSQFWPSAGPARYTFPRRNVVTSGITQGTVVIEASNTSGAKMQARLALEHGKHVFLVHSLVTKQPWASSFLQRPRCVEVYRVDDVVRHLRDPRAIEELSSERQQLALDFG